MTEISVIMYHYVREIKNSQFPKIKGIETQLFLNQIKYLNKYYQFVTIEDVIDSIFNNKLLPSKSVLLTFDDGYSDHYTNVFPILQEFGVKGSFYLPAKAIKERKMLDVNKIHFILASVKNKNEIIKDIQNLLIHNKSEYGLQDFDYYYKKLAETGRFDSAKVIFIKRLLQTELNEVLRSLIVDILFNKYVKVKETDFAKELYLNEKQIKEMLNSGMHIGCHGYNHYRWNKIQPEKLENEIDLSLAFLKELGVDLTNWTAAYPYGSYNKEVENLLKQKKCQLAFTTNVGIAKTKMEGRLLLNRLDTNDFPKKSNAKPNIWFYKSL